MITFLEGVIEERQPTRVVLNVGGVGYEVLVPLSSYERLPTAGTCRLLIFDYVREDQHTLFGFMSEDERRMFTLLMGVSGIGPKLAMSALSGLSVRDLQVAVVEGDHKRLSGISGVGRKMAERIVVELRDRLALSEALQAVSATPRRDEDMKTRDAILALVALGYKEADGRKLVERVLQKHGDQQDVETIIRMALAR